MPKKSKRTRRKKDRSARKIQQATRDRLSRKKEAATKIQSRLRGNMTRRKEDIPWTEPLLSVPYRDTDWKNVEGLEFPWEAEKKVLKSIIHPEGLDDITEGIDRLEKEYYKTTCRDCLARLDCSLKEVHSFAIRPRISAIWWIEHKGRVLHL